MGGPERVLDYAVGGSDVIYGWSLSKDTSIFVLDSVCRLVVPRVDRS